MSGLYWFAFALAIAFLSLISALYHKKRGYFFWRTFILACMGFGGLGLLFFSLFLV